MVEQLTIYHGAPWVAARSAYLQQVRRIAPPDPPGLIGRDEELAELARFCMEPDRSPYLWWQAGAWAGKSALLSRFVLRPPPEVHDQVRIVSFFITARLGAQDTREAFTEVLLEQLAELTGQGLPPVLPETTRDAYLLDLLAQAADACRAADGRLILVVDGLDEDQGVTTGPDAHSIAGLLPADPPAGMRVVVAGRSNPPIPDDVPDWHPLRDPRIIRPLSDSPYARNVQRLGNQELQRLLRGTVAEQDLLGLVAAARGGLSGSDLEELTGVPLWEVEEILHTVAGRTFSRRASRSTPGSGPEVYLLGHEELQAAASRYLGRRLASYRDRLHGWTDTYRAREWPPGTPEYLLTGYFRLLVTVGDLSRVIACAGDAARHDRMLDLTGADTAALSEVRTALDLIAAQDNPDLCIALRLAYHRSQLVDRNTSIPASLPAVWAALGQVSRAEALGTSISDLGSRAEALARIAGALATAGQQQRASTVAGQAEAVARSLADPDSQAVVLARVAGALAEAGGPRQHAAALAVEARSVAESLHADWAGAVLAEAAGALAQAGRHQQAVAVTRSISDTHLRADTFARVAGTLANAGAHQQAAAVARLAGAMVRRYITYPPSQAQALAWIAGALAGAGKYQEAETAADQAEAVARSISDQGRQAEALAELAGALAKAGAHQRAEIIARSIAVPHWQAQALAEVAGALAGAGAHQLAAAFANQAEAKARSIISEPAWDAEGLAKAARALARTGEHQQAAALARRAEAMARSITNSADWQARSLAESAGALARAGADVQAEAVARSITDRYGQMKAQEEVAEALALTGVHPKAEAVARSITDVHRQALALAMVADAAAWAGANQQAVAVAGEAEAVARRITDLSWQPLALAQVAGALARAGAHERAEAVARSITASDWQARALARAAEALAGAGAHQQAAAVASQAEAVACSDTNAESKARALAEVAGALAKAGQFQRAEEVARSITDPEPQAQALADIAGALAKAGAHLQAAAVASQAEAAASSIAHPDRQPEALAAVTAILAEAGAHQPAEAIARAIADPYWQAEALADVALGLAEAGDIRSARRVAVAVCAVGEWATAAKPVLILDKSAYATLTSLLDNSHQPQPSD